MSDSSKEREILMVMRKVLGNIVKDTTPPPGTKHPLSDATIHDIRMCLGLITARERELADEAGAIVEKPYFTDQPRSEKVVSFPSVKKNNSDEETE
ncbi:MAG: segregation and condensation protein A [Chromatiales bacterium]|nr:segregation and condensation protein A [Chromatiales bacterium]